MVDDCNLDRAKSSVPFIERLEHPVDIFLHPEVSLDLPNAIRTIFVDQRFEGF